MKKEYDFENGTSAHIYQSDALDALKLLDDNSVDSVVTDPPYGLSQNKKIDYAEVMTAWLAGEEATVKAKSGLLGLSWDAFVPSPALWKECLRVLKPGGLLVAFSGARTHDLMGISIRMAGFQMKEMLTWHKTNAFFKTRYIQRETGAGGAVNNNIANRLEPITVAQKPPEGTLKNNFDKYGVGGFFFKDNYVSRVPGDKEHPHSNDKIRGSRVFGKASNARDFLPEGRIPTNIAFSHDTDCLPNEDDTSSVFSISRDTTGCVAGCPVLEMPLAVSSNNLIINPDKLLHTEGIASAKERVYCENSEGREVFHHTVKPLNLMRWLTRLVTPEGGTTVDPFLGSGTTAEAAAMEGRSCVGAERFEDYHLLIEKRMVRAQEYLTPSLPRMEPLIPLP